MVRVRPAMSASVKLQGESRPSTHEVRGRTALRRELAREEGLQEWVEWVHSWVRAGGECICRVIAKAHRGINVGERPGSVICLFTVIVAIAVAGVKPGLARQLVNLSHVRCIALALRRRRRGQ